MDLSIIVVSYNTRDLLAACLRSIHTQLPAGLSAETFVVDNASVDGSADMVAADFPRVRLIRNADNRGFGAANNQAIALSRGRYILLLNSDASLQPQTVAAMVAQMDKDNRVAIVGGRLLNADQTFQSSFFDFPTWKSELLLLTGLARRVYGPTYPSYPEHKSVRAAHVDWVSGALFMIRRQAIEQVGAFDERFFMYAEEMDWCFRMREAGWLVAYVPDAAAVHISAASAHHQPERRRAQVYLSKCLFVRKHWGRRQASLFVLLVRLMSAAKLGVWWTRTLSSKHGADKSSAEHNVTSYRFLLSNLAGAL